MIRRKRHIWLVATVCTVLTMSVVATAVMLLYPRELWAWEFSVSMPLTAVLTFPLTAFMASLVYRNSTLNAELTRLVNRDRLTDAATRDFFFQRMEDQPDAYGVSLVIDIDHFKRVNDTHGHLAGDVVIQRVAAILQENCRENDIVCRFGGEEFVVFLNETTPDRGAAVAERIRSLIEAAMIFEDNRRIPVTVSIGGSLKEAARDIGSAIREADAALYRAKELGRNRIIMSWIDKKAA